jgi:hypothetical protein
MFSHFLYKNLSSTFLSLHSSEIYIFIEFLGIIHRPVFLYKVNRFEA